VLQWFGSATLVLLAFGCGRVGYDVTGGGADGAMDGAVGDGSGPDTTLLDGSVSDTAVDSSAPDAAITGDVYLRYVSAQFGMATPLTAAGDEMVGGIVMREAGPDRWAGTVRYAGLVDGAPQAEPVTTEGVFTREDAGRWLFEPTDTSPPPVALTLGVVEGRWTFTIDETDPRNSGLAGEYPRVSVLDVIDAPPTESVGAWRVASITVDGEDYPTEVCVPKDGVYLNQTITTTVTAAHVAIYDLFVEEYSDPLCRMLTGSTAYQVRGFFVELPGMVDAYLWDGEVSEGIYMRLGYTTTPEGYRYNRSLCRPTGCEDSFPDALDLVPLGGS